MIFEIVPLGSKDKTRIVEHGKLWRKTTAPHVHRHGFELLESCKTGYVKWWRTEQMTERADV